VLAFDPRYYLIHVPMKPSMKDSGIQPVSPSSSRPAILLMGGHGFYLETDMTTLLMNVDIFDDDAAFHVLSSPNFGLPIWLKKSASRGAARDSRSASTAGFYLSTRGRDVDYGHDLKTVKARL